MKLEVGKTYINGNLSRTITKIENYKIYYTNQKGRSSNCWITTFEDWVRAGERKINHCEYCNNMKSLHYNRDGVIQEVYIEPDKTLSITHPMSEFSINIKINYCPMCGRKLNK